MDKSDRAAQDGKVADHWEQHFYYAILVVLEKMAEVGAHVEAAELFEFESFCADGALVDAGDGLKQSSSPFVDVFEGDVASEWVYD